MEKPVRSKKRQRIKKRVTTLPVKFLLLQLVLPVSDTVTDILTGFSYYKQGHVKWASSIWILMSGPLALKSLVGILKSIVNCSKRRKTASYQSPQEKHELRTLNKVEEPQQSEDLQRDDLERQPSAGNRFQTDVFMEYAATIPIFQPFVHLYFANQLQEADIGMGEAKKTYYAIEKKVKKWKGGEDERIQMRDDVKRAARGYLDSKQKYCKLLNMFQGIRLYEVFGESGPQAVLQMSIAFRIGYTNYLQVLGIVISVVSLASGAAQTLLLKGTKRNEMKEESWRHTWLIFFPIMIGLTLPRVMTLALINAYAKVYTIIFILLFIFAGLVFNLHPYVKRDPADALLGVVTNLFGPCIIIEEGSKFLVKSSIIATVLHSLNIVILTSLVISGSYSSTIPGFGFAPQKDNNPPLIHCFGNNLATNSSFLRCPFNSSELTDCIEGLFSQLSIKEWREERIKNELKSLNNDIKNMDQMYKSWKIELKMLNNQIYDKSNQSDLFIVELQNQSSAQTSLTENLYGLSGGLKSLTKGLKSFSEDHMSFTEEGIDFNGNNSLIEDLMEFTWNHMNFTEDNMNFTKEKMSLTEVSSLIDYHMSLIENYNSLMRNQKTISKKLKILIEDLRILIQDHKILTQKLKILAADLKREKERKRELEKEIDKVTFEQKQFITNINDQEEASYSTYCNNMELWLPLVVTMSTLLALLILSIPLTLLMNWLLDPIALTIASKCCLRCCFPGSYLPPMWNEHNEFESPVFGILKSNHYISGFKDRYISDLPQAEAYEHMCAPLCISLRLKLGKFVRMLHISKLTPKIWSDSEARGVNDTGELDEKENERVGQADVDDEDLGSVEKHQEEGYELADDPYYIGQAEVDDEDLGSVELHQEEDDGLPDDPSQTYTPTTDANKNSSDADAESEPGWWGREFDLYDSDEQPEDEDEGIVNHTGFDIINWAIDRDCHLLLTHILAKMEISVDKSMLNRACTVVNGRAGGSPKTINFLLEMILQTWSVMDTFAIENEGFSSSYVKEELVKIKHKLSKARKQPDSRGVFEVLNHLTALSGGTNIGDKNMDEVYFLQVQMNIPMERAINLCDALSLQESSASWFLRNAIQSRMNKNKGTYDQEA